MVCSDEPNNFSLDTVIAATAEVDTECTNDYIGIAGTVLTTSHLLIQDLYEFMKYGP